MRLDDETTAYQLHRLLSDKGYSISLCTILRCRTAFGWTFRGSAYCQLIREAKAQEHLHDTFEKMWSGPMSALCKWKATGDSHVENVKKHLVLSQGKSLQVVYMYMYMHAVPFISISSSM